MVINKWASWCVPCQGEFAVFESVGTERGKEVAFLGVNGTDKDPAARKFLAKRWLPFPSYTDPQRGHRAGARGAQELPDDGVRRRARARPPTSTRGPYRSDKQLNDDIDSYLKLECLKSASTRSRG